MPVEILPACIPAAIGRCYSMKIRCARNTTVSC